MIKRLLLLLFLLPTLAFAGEQLTTYDPATGKESITEVYIDTAGDKLYIDGNVGITEDLTTGGTCTISGATTISSDLTVSGGAYYYGNGSKLTGIAAGANTALSNLASVAVNTNIISDADSIDDLGSSSKSWANIWADNIKQGTVTDLTIDNDGLDKDIIMKINDGGGEETVFQVNGATGIITTAQQSAARAYINSAQNDLTNATEVKIHLDTETYDIQNEFDSTTNYRFTATVAGLYLINAQVAWKGVTVDKRYYAVIRVNGASVVYSATHASHDAYTYSVVSDIVSLAIGDYVELFGMSMAGVDTADIEIGSVKTFMSITKIH